MKEKNVREHVRHFVRVFWIDHELRADRYPNATTIAEHFEVTPKTAQRTIDFMRDQMRMPLDYSAERRGWYYTEPVYGLPAVEMSEGELVAILLAEKLARQYHGTAVGRQIEEAFAKMLGAVTNVISVDLNALAEAHSFEAAATTEPNFETIRQLGRSINKRLRVEMTYFTAGRGELTHRQVDPLHLRNSLGEWYLIAWDHLRQEPRDFLVSRIRELTMTDQKFDWPVGFVLDEYLNSGFGMFRGGQVQEVEIIFDEYQARWIRERSKFHKSEEREEMPDGRLVLRMKVTALDGVKRFVMQYGRHAEVIKPEDLRKSIYEEIEVMGELYQ